MDQVTFNYQQDNDHGGDWDWDDKQRKDDVFNNEELMMMITIQESLPLLNFGSNQHPFVTLIQNFFVNFLLARIPPLNQFSEMGLAWALELPWRGSDVILSLVIHEEVTILHWSDNYDEGFDKC